jgi:hypothetical protein
MPQKNPPLTRSPCRAFTLKNASMMLRCCVMPSLPAAPYIQRAPASRR